MIPAFTTVVAGICLVPLAANRTRLGRVCLVDYFKGNALVLEFVLQILLDFPEVPIREFLGYLSLADFLSGFGSSPVLFLPS